MVRLLYLQWKFENILTWRATRKMQWWYNKEMHARHMENTIGKQRSLCDWQLLHNIQQMAHNGNLACPGSSWSSYNVTIAEFPVKRLTACACGSSWRCVFCGSHWLVTTCRPTSIWLRSGWSRWRRRRGVSLRLTFRGRSAVWTDLLSAELFTLGNCYWAI